VPTDAELATAIEEIEAIATPDGAS
jgi:hypothetical protein